MEVRGRIVRGLRAASGASRRPGQGTSGLQLPHFRRQLPEFDSFFDGRPHSGTLNVEVPRRRVQVGRPPFHLRDVRWEHGTTEHFYLSPCTLSYAGRRYRGLIYIPDPATKPAGLPTGEVLEVLTSSVPFIRYGARVRLSFDDAAVELVPTPPRSRSRRSAGRVMCGRRAANRATPGASS